MATYDFTTLSPIDFEELIRDLLQAEEGIRLESFGPGPDQGIDFRYAAGGDRLIVQAKRYTGEFSDLIAAARKEDAKVRSLQSTRYILATSASLSPARKDQLIAAMPSAPLVQGDVLGREDLNNLLTLHPKVERDHFKLWLASSTVLERIIHSQLLNRTKAELAEIRAVVPRFVTNDSVAEAMKILESHGALIISGEPGVGKSTLARMLVWTHAHQNWRVTVIDDLADAFTLEHGDDPHLVFFDDFLGQVALTPDWIRTADQRLPPFLRKARSSPNLRFIMTTRDYILKGAQERSERLSSPDLKLTEFVLDVGAYTRTVKARMLFNHIHFSDLDPADRAALLADDFYLKIIGHKNYNPRIISLLTSRDYRLLDDEPDIRKAFLRVLDQPSVLWEKPYRNHITDDARALLLALLFNRPQVSRAALGRSFDRLCAALGRPTSATDRTQRFTTTLRSLEGSMVALEKQNVRFGNPGVRDFLQRVVVEDGQLLPIAERLESFDEVSAAWEIWSAQGRSPTPLTQCVWTTAARAMMEYNTGSDLDHLALLMDMQGGMAEADAGALINQALDVLESSEIESDEWEQLQSMIDDRASDEERTELETRIWEILTYRGIALLETHGGHFDLETLESVATTLVDSGCDGSTARQAAHTALSMYLDSLSSVLNEINSYQELDEFEQQLDQAMRTWGASHIFTESRFQDRRESLEYSSRPYSGGGWSAAATPPSISDDGIRSMFSVLK